MLRLDGKQVPHRYRMTEANPREKKKGKVYQMLRQDAQRPADWYSDRHFARPVGYLQACVF
ncbi:MULTISPECIES: hypothetical protein [Acetobacter]|uniref:hypothetical protein n=1 Tax=Acetobacter TaxID=434 RepID=UPI0012E75825|nr:hypothetical protein [Acetobacter cerevisiae]